MYDEILQDLVHGKNSINSIKFCTGNSINNIKFYDIFTVY